MISYISEIHECELEDFPAWDGGATRLEAIKEFPRVMEAVERELFIMEEDKGMPLTDEEINDYLWFDMDDDLEAQYLYDPETDTYHNDDSWYE